MTIFLDLKKILAMKEQVNKAYEEGNSEDEKTESLSEVKRVLYYQSEQVAAIISPSIFFTML